MNEGRGILGLGLVTGLAFIGGFELALFLASQDALPELVHPTLEVYVQLRTVPLRWAKQHPYLLTALLFLTLFFLRHALQAWHNTLLPRLMGTRFEPMKSGFPKTRFSLVEALKGTPTGQYFLGRDPGGKAAYLGERDLCTHGHIMGQTGSGKTASVLAPLMLQDMRHGKGLVFIDAKGSADNVALMRGMANVVDRLDDLRVFALAHGDYSDTYNPVFMESASDPLAVAERVFSVFALEHEYYGGQARLLFGNLLRLFASTGEAFHLQDIRLAILDDEALTYVMGKSGDAKARYEIERQYSQLGKKRHEVFTGLTNALAQYDHPLLNSYAPTLRLEKLVEQRGLAYFNLPANLYPYLAPAIGKIVLQHIKSFGAERQAYRDSRDQHPFSVNIDELNRFAFDELVPALAMLRDANMQFRLSHQSLGDLEQVSPVFAQQVKDNTRWKVFLFENDAEHLEKLARSYGTRTVLKKTIRFAPGPLLTLLNTGEVSSREVEEFVLHPNALKSLAPCGQGYLLLPNKTIPLNLEPLPNLKTSAWTTKTRPDAAGINLSEKFVPKGEQYAA